MKCRVMSADRDDELAWVAWPSAPRPGDTVHVRNENHDVRATVVRVEWWAREWAAGLGVCEGFAEVWVREDEAVA